MLLLSSGGGAPPAAAVTCHCCGVGGGVGGAGNSARVVSNGSKERMGDVPICCPAHCCLSCHCPAHHVALPIVVVPLLLLLLSWPWALSVVLRWCWWLNKKNVWVLGSFG